MKPLSRRQIDVLMAIRESVNRNGTAPTLIELCKAIGTSSPGSMSKHLQELQDRGLIQRGSGSRQIVLNGCCPYCGKDTMGETQSQEDWYRSYIREFKRAQKAEAEIASILSQNADLVDALSRIITAHDQFHIALAGVPGGDEDHAEYVAAQSEHELAIRAGRAALSKARGEGETS